ncbi:BA14K family protein [Paraburkholderia aspalathi]|nr:BA14K family protein [Paraburkholderia aspalathi]
MASQPSYAAPTRNYHVEWCLGRYRSYDVRSNSYQRSNGPRQYCSSPISLISCEFMGWLWLC